MVQYTENQITFIKSNTRMYRVWASMKSRCYNPNTRSYKDYGMRGIIVCDRWKNSFDNFYLDVGDRPSKDYTLDRINNDGNYEPSNVKWNLIVNQANNRRNNTYIVFNNETKTLSNWAKEYKIPVKTLSDRLRRGMDIERALTKPLQKDNRLAIKPVIQLTKKSNIIINKFKSMKEAEEITKIKAKNISGAIARDGGAGGFIWKYQTKEDAQA